MFSKQPHGASLLILSLCYYCIAYFNTSQLCLVVNLFKSDYPRRKKKSWIITASRSPELRQTLFGNLFVHCLANWLFPLTATTASLSIPTVQTDGEFRDSVKRCLTSRDY